MTLPQLTNMGMKRRETIMFALAAVVFSLVGSAIVIKWSSYIVPLSVAFLMLLGVAFLKWGVHAVVWNLFCLSIPLVMVRSSVFDSAFNISPAMILALLSGIIWIIHARHEQMPPLRFFRPGIMAVSLYLMLSVISILWTPTDSVKSALISISHYLFGVFLYVLLSAVLRTRRELETAIQLILVSLGVTFTFLLYYYLIYLGRNYVGVWFADDIGESGKNMLAYMIALFLPIMIARVLLVEHHKKIIKFAEWGIIAIYIITLLFSTSRGSYLTIAVVIAFLLLYLSGRARRRLAIITGASILFIFLYQPTAVVLNLRSLGNILSFGTGEIMGSVGGVTYRVDLARAAWENFRQSPIFGLGLSSFQGPFQEAFSRATHNDYLRVLAETGIIGLLIYVYFFLAHLLKLTKIVWIQRRTPQWLEVGLLGSLVSMIIRLAFINADTFYITWVMFGLIAVLLINSDSVDSHIRFHKPQKR